MTIEISIEQQKAIERSEPLLGVRGCAGSGKSLVAMLRAVHQLARAGSDEGRVLVLTFNRPLVSYLRGLLRQDEFIYPQTTLEEVQLPTDLSEWDFDGQIHIDNYDRFGRELLNGAEIELVTVEERIEAAIVRAAEAVGATYSAQLARRVRRVGMNGAATIEEADEFVPGFRRLKSRQQTWDVRSAWVSEMEQTSTVHGWGELALGLRRAIERSAIAPGACRFEHLVLDEIQDFTPAWIRLARRYLVAEEGSITVVGDAAQTLYPRLGRRANLPRKELGFPRANTKDAAVMTLGEASYRMARNPAARSLARWWHARYLAPRLEADARDGHVSLLSQKVRQSMHTCHAAEDPLTAESRYVMERAKRLLGSGSVAILLPAVDSIGSLNSRWKQGIVDAGVTVRSFREETRRANAVVSFWGEDSRASVWFVSYRYAKGAEWDYVFVPRLSDWCLERELDGFHTLKERALDDSDTEGAVSILDEALYVAMTRARKGLYLSAPFRVSSMFDGAPVDIRQV